MKKTLKKRKSACYHSLSHWLKKTNKKTTCHKSSLKEGRKSTAYGLLVGAYFGIVLASYAYFGVLFQSTIGLVSLVLIPVVFLIGRARESLQDWSRFITLMLSYEALQGIVPFVTASRGIVSVYSLDRMLWGFNLTGQFQSYFYSEVATDIFTMVYSLQFILVAVLALTLWFTTRLYFKRYAYALIITSYSCLVFFLMVPTSPPWYVGAASNLLQKGSSSVPSLLTPLINLIDNATDAFVSDKFAALPSMHAAYAILFGYYMPRAKSTFAFFAIPITAGILFSTLYLGQHYLIDLLAGSSVAIGSIIVSNRLSRK